MRPLAEVGSLRHASSMELPIERADVQAILEGLFDANSKLNDTLSYLFGEDDEEEPADS
jgi:hypothetical protein